MQRWLKRPIEYGTLFHYEGMYRKVLCKDRIVLIIVATLVATVFGGCIVTVEETKYDVFSKDGNYEIRDYPPYIVAEIIVDGTLESAGNLAFNRLFAYISGKNKASAKISMTAPVSQEAASEKIAMTAPVGQRRIEEGWAVSFTMPAKYTMETIPVPDDPAVKLRLVPARRMATVRYSGTWSEQRYRRYLGELEYWIKQKGYRILGEAVWARYNPPFTPWFLRRNEILIPVDTCDMPK